MVDKLPQATGNFSGQIITDFYRKNFNVSENCYKLSVLSEDAVLKIVNSIGSNKATGLDNLPAKFLKDSINVTIGPLTHIVNLSIHSGIVPNDLKSARVVPLFKKNDKTNAGNYRPVSILSIVSKILEKAVYQQVENYLLDKNLLFENQSGFRSGFSTDTCLISLTDHIKHQSDQGFYTGMILLDLQKAFDTVDHSILLNKMSAMGFSFSTVNWFKSYLSDRIQVVDLSGTTSTIANVCCGVPQGSILGPLLFLLYVNDMQIAVNCKLLLYADDSALIVSGNCIGSIEQELGLELESVSEWLIDNKLSLHLGKTEAILFGPKRKVKNAKLNVTCKGTQITSTESVTYLGAELDSCLSGEAMALKVLTKCNSRLKFLFRKAKYLTSHARKLLASALVQCHLDYACCYWYNSLTLGTKNQLQATQNRLIRFTLDLPYRANIGAEHFSKVDWLPVGLRVKQIIATNVYRINTRSAPEYMYIHFHPLNHNHYTRNSVNSYSVPHVSTYGIKSFFYSGIILWNSLPICIKNATSIKKFKTQMEKHLFNQYHQKDKNVFNFM